jgi:hypothetical protein
MNSNNEVTVDQVPLPKRKGGRPKLGVPTKFIGVHVTVEQAEAILKLHGKYSKGIREIIDFYLAEHKGWQPSQNITGEND